MNQTNSRNDIPKLPLEVEMAVSSEKLTADVATTLVEEIVSRTKSRQRRVHFNETVKGRVFPGIPHQEKKNVWYTSAEHEEACKNERILRQSFSHNHQLLRQYEEHLIAQGVMTDERTTNLELLVASSTKAVFEEQERQEALFFETHKSEKEFRLDDEKIAAAYRIFSKVAMDQAQSRAIRHEKHLKNEEKSSQESNNAPVTLSRFLRRGISPTRRSTTGRKKTSLVQRFLPKPSTFLSKASSTKVASTTVAA